MDLSQILLVVILVCGDLFSATMRRVEEFQRTGNKRGIGRWTTTIALVSGGEEEMATWIVGLAVT